MIVVQPQGRLLFGLFLGLLGCCLFLGATANGQQKPPPKEASDRAAEIKALLKERQNTLSKLVAQLRAQYQAGTVDLSRVVQAERDFLKATVDLDDNPEKRLAALRKALETVKQIAQIAEAKSKAGIVGPADVLQARAVLLEVRIELLRQELKSQLGK